MLIRVLWLQPNVQRYRYRCTQTELHKSFWNAYVLTSSIYDVNYAQMYNLPIGNSNFHAQYQVMLP